MKSLKFFIIFCTCMLFTTQIKCQIIDEDNLVGIWQSKSKSIGSAWLDNYQFFHDGNFSFNLSQYDELKSIVSIKGKWRLSNDTIYFNVESSIEMTCNGSIIRNYTAENNYWSVDCAPVYNVIDRKSDYEEIGILGACKSDIDSKCILLDGDRFYKIKDDPSDY